MDAFENHTVFKDKGIMKSVISAIGRQDINHDSMIPMDGRIDFIGAIFDHLIMDMTATGDDYEVGSIVLKYSGSLKAFTSEYVEKVLSR